MQKCDKCKEKFDYIEVWCKIFWGFGYRDIQCKKCGKKYSISNSSRLLIGILIALPVFIKLAWFQGNISTLVFCFIYLAVVITVIPLIARYKLVEQECNK